MEYGSYRSAWAEIDLDRVKENIRIYKKWIGQETKFMAVIKADGYGHGAIEVGKAAVEAGADYLAVAVSDEALELRHAGITAPILQLSPIETHAVEAAIKENVSLTVFTTDIAKKIIQAADKLNKKATVHIKVDTGMSRIGVRTKEEALELTKILASSENIELEGIFTHFADAENLENPDFTHHQYETLMDIISFLEEKGHTFPIRHCCNTAATLGFPEMKLDMVRVGIGVVGLDPDRHFEGIVPVKPALKVKSRVVYVKAIPEGQTVGYGRTYTADSERLIATVPIGYADGMPRILSNQTLLTVHGQAVPIAGRVCMDQIMLDVTSVPDVKEGDEVIYFGDASVGEPSAYDAGELAQSNHYEIICALSKRIPRMYVSNGTVTVKKNGLLD